MTRGRKRIYRYRVCTACDTVLHITERLCPECGGWETYIWERETPLKIESRPT